MPVATEISLLPLVREYPPQFLPLWEADISINYWSDHWELYSLSVWYVFYSYTHIYFLLTKFHHPFYCRLWFRQLLYWHGGWPCRRQPTWSLAPHVQTADRKWRYYSFELIVIVNKYMHIHTTALLLVFINYYYLSNKRGTIYILLLR